MSKYKVTESGLEQIKNKKAELEQKMIQLNQQIQESLSSSNSEESIQYRQLVDETVQIREEIEDLASIIENTSTITNKSFTQTQLGCTVKLSNHQLCHMFQLVEPVEADSREGKISTKSPLGQSITGKGVGEYVFVNTPAGQIEFEIMAIN